MSNRATALRTNPVKITYDCGKDRYRKCVGKKRTPDGKLIPRIFWLGSVQHEALLKAKVYAEVWAELQDHELERGQLSSSRKQSVESRGLKDGPVCARNMPLTA